MNAAGALYRRQAVLGVRWAVPALVLASVANWSSHENRDHTLEVGLVAYGVVLALMASRLRTRAFGEYLRSLPIGRGRDLTAMHHWTCAWGVGAGVLVHLVESTGAAWLVVRAWSDVVGGEAPAFHRRPLFPLAHLVGHPLLAFWGTTWIVVRAGEKRIVDRAVLLLAGAGLVGLPWLAAIALRELDVPVGETSLASATGVASLALGIALARRACALFANLPLEALPIVEVTP